MGSFWSPDADVFVWVALLDGGLMLDRGRDDGRGNLSLSQGGCIQRTRVVGRGRHEDLARPYFSALTCDLPGGLAAAVNAHIGKRIPAWLVAEMRLHLENRIRAGDFILAGKRTPIAADAPWQRFDPSSLAAWDFRMDNTAVPILGGGYTYDVVTAFTPAQWQAVQSPAPSSTTASDKDAAPGRTGAPGRPSSMHLVRQEHARRLQAGKAEASLAAEARYLARWLRDTHPGEPPPTQKTIENRIRDQHHREKAKPPK